MRAKTIRARQLRRRATRAECLAWTLLRDHRCLDYRFRRQHVIRGFICDFYCHELRLVIELDGAVHHNQYAFEYDERRSGVLQRLGIQVRRIRNEEVCRERLLAVFGDAERRTPSPRCGEGDRG
ncbi:MAG: endonuclease domain-containing protein [Gemmatimonadales bacterium]